MNKKKITFLFLFFSFSAISQVSHGKITKLFDLFILEKYEKCLVKAEKYTSKKKYKKNPEPYLYVSMCLLKIKDDPELNIDDRFKNAIKNSLKYGLKFVQIDNRLRKKKKQTLYDKNYKYIQNLKSECIDEASNFILQKKYSKAIYYYKKLLKLDENDYSLKIMLGALQIKNKNIVEGLKIVNIAIDSINNKLRKGYFHINEESYKAFEDGILEIANYYISINNPNKAYETMEFARFIDPNNKTFKFKMSEINIQ